jgi:hypothetical protein
VEARNTQSAGVEALGVKFRLSDASTGKFYEQTIFAHLNVLPGNGHLPVMAYFDVPGLRNPGIEASIESYLPLGGQETRYPAIQIEDRQDQVEANTAQVTGSVKLSSPGVQVKEIWVLAAAYGPGGELVGLRRWDSPQGLSTGGKSLPFSLRLYSLGPKISRVELFAEAHADTSGITPTVTP